MQIDVGLERRRELDTINQLLSMACGASTIVPSDPNNPCNTEFVTVNVLGNTAAELRAPCGAVSGTVEPIEFAWQAVVSVSDLSEGRSLLFEHAR